MIRISALMLFACYVLPGLFVLSIAPASIGVPMFVGCVTLGLWLSSRMVRLRVQRV